LNTVQFVNQDDLECAKLIAKEEAKLEALVDIVESKDCKAALKAPKVFQCLKQQ